MLDGYRVVELGMWVAAPAATGLLAEWGADVVKVEPPTGEPMRRLFALLSGHGTPESPPFDQDNRSKRSIVVDLTETSGREQLDALLDTADVFVTNLRAAALDRLGFAPGGVLQRHPRLVYAIITGYGLDGPEADRAGYDIGAFWARSGVAHSFAPQGSPPFPLRGGFGDHVTALATVAGVNAALLERTRTGLGGLVEVSLLRTGMWCLGWDVSIQERFAKVLPTPQRTEDMNPMTNAYRAADDRWFWLLGVEADRLWPKLCTAIGRDGLVDDERFATARDRRHNRRELITLLDEVFAAEDRDHWARAFDAHDVWWAPVNTTADLADDPQVLASGAFVEVPDGAWADAHRGVAGPVEFRAPDGSARDRSVGPPPALGEHTDEVLDDLGPH